MHRVLVLDGLVVDPAVGPDTRVRTTGRWTPLVVDGLVGVAADRLVVVLHPRRWLRPRSPLVAGHQDDDESQRDHAADGRPPDPATGLGLHRERTGLRARA